MGILFNLNAFFFVYEAEYLVICFLQMFMNSRTFDALQKISQGLEYPIDLIGADLFILFKFDARLIQVAFEFIIFIICIVFCGLIFGHFMSPYIARGD